MNDQELLVLLKDPAARSRGFEQLVRMYQEKIYWTVRKMVIDHDDANDVTQDAFVKVWKNLDKFREDAQLYTWVYRIATNECLNFLKKKKRRYFVSWEDAESELSNKVDHSDLQDGTFIEKKLQKALLTLPDKQRLVFTMKYFDEMKYEEIAQITETSVGALKASYHHAVKKIEKLLNED